MRQAGTMEAKACLNPPSVQTKNKPKKLKNSILGQKGGKGSKRGGNIFKQTSELKVLHFNFRGLASECRLYEIEKALKK